MVDSGKILSRYGVGDYGCTLRVTQKLKIPQIHIFLICRKSQVSQELIIQHLEAFQTRISVVRLVLVEVFIIHYLFSFLFINSF